MKTAWLFLGDLAYRAPSFPCPVVSGDVVLLGPPQPMFRPVCKCGGFSHVDVEVLGQEPLSGEDLDAALAKVESATKIIRDIGCELMTVQRPWWMFRATYFVTAVRENVLGSIALEKWLMRQRPDNVVIVREHKKLVSIDMSNPCYNGPDNVMSFVAEKICQNLNIPYKVSYHASIKRTSQRFISDYLRPRVTARLRMAALLYNTVKQRLTTSNINDRKGCVLYFTRSLTHTRTFIDLIKTVPSSIKQLMLFQSPISQKITNLDIDIDAIRFERFCSIRRILSAIFCSKQANFRVDTHFSDPIVSGFTDTYILHSVIHGNILKPYFEGMKAALTIIKPSLIISSDESSPFNQLLFEAAVLQKIPTISIQHGELTAAEAISMHTPMGGDFHLVRPGGTRNFFISRGMPESNIAVYGNLCTSLTVNGTKKNPHVQATVPIFIAGTALGIKEFWPVIKDFVIHIMNLIPNAVITFRPHPSESVSEYIRNAKLEHLPMRVVSGKDPLEAQIEHAKLAVVFSSSLALDLVLNGVPTVICNFGRWPLLGYLHEMFLITYSLKDTALALFDLASDEQKMIDFYAKREKFILEFLATQKSPESDDWWQFLRGKFLI